MPFQLRYNLILIRDNHWAPPLRLLALAILREAVNVSAFDGVG